MIDGVDVTPDAKRITVSIEGNVDSIITDYADVVVNRTANQIEAKNGNISCGDVSGDETTKNGNIRCGKVSGDATTKNGYIVYQSRPDLTLQLERRELPVLNMGVES